MNHVPDAVLDRLDALGWATLRAEPITIAVGLRRDLRLHVAYDGSRSPFVVRFCHRESPRDRIRDHGSWLATYVDGVDTRLSAWGLRPPDAYSHHPDEFTVRDQVIEQPADWQPYDGRVSLPGEPSLE